MKSLFSLARGQDRYGSEAVKNSEHFTSPSCEEGNHIRCKDQECDCGCHPWNKKQNASGKMEVRQDKNTKEWFFAGPTGSGVAGSYKTKEEAREAGLKWWKRTYGETPEVIFRDAVKNAQEISGNGHDVDTELEKVKQDLLMCERKGTWCKISISGNIRYVAPKYGPGWIGRASASDIKRVAVT